MSVSKKRAAPKPPILDLAGGQNMESVITAEKENGKEAVKKKTSSEKVSLKIVLPNQAVEEIQISPETPLIDLRTQLCAKHKFLAGSYRLEPLDVNGRSIPFMSSSTIASTSAKAVHLKPKAKEPVIAAPPKVVEQTVRLTIKMSRSNQQILRVRPSVPLSTFLPQILEKSGLKHEDFKYLELRHPDQTNMKLDTTRTLDEYKIREIFVADKRVYIESPKPEPQPESPTSTLEKYSGKVVADGSAKRSKGIRKFFKIPKKQKSSSASSSEPLSPSSPETSPPPIPESRSEVHANSNENNSAEREKSAKKKRPAPVKQNDQQAQVENESLHGQVTEKMEVAQEETIENKTPVESEAHEDEIDVIKIPSSPPSRPTAPPRAKPRNLTTGKKKAPPPPARVTEPPPQAEPASPKERPSRPEKPPRTQSIGRQISPERTQEREETEKTDSETEETTNDGDAIEIEVSVGKPAQNTLEVGENIQEYMDVHTEDVEEDGPGGGSSPEISDDELPQPAQTLEESERMEVIANETALPQEEIEPPPSPLAVNQPVIMPSGASEPAVEEVVQLQEEDEPDMLAEGDQMLVERVEQVIFETPATDMPMVTADVSSPPEQDKLEPSALAESPPSSPELEKEFEILPAVGEIVPSPEAEETKYTHLPPPDVIARPEPESPTVPDDVPPEIADMIHHHDLGFKIEPVLTEDDLWDNPEPVIPAEPEVKAPEPSVLQDEDNLFTTPDDFDVYDTKKDDYASMEAKALEMIKQFALSESVTEEPVQQDVGEEEYFPPPPPDILDNITLPPLGQVDDEKDMEVEEPEEKTDEETQLEIERLKEQINSMRLKKAKKEAEEEAARKQPYKIIPETKSSVAPGQVQGKGVKTFTFVPNQRTMKHYEDYEAAPELVINFSKSGEIKGMGIPEPSRENIETTSKKTPSPTLEKPTSPKFDERPSAPKVPETVIIVPMVTPAPVETAQSPVSPTKPAPPQKPAELASKPAPSVVKPKGYGGYVSSAGARQPATSAPAQTYTPALYGNADEPKKAALPNYYKRFFKDVGSTPGTDQKSPPKSVPNGSVTAPKSPPPLAQKPNSPKLAQTVNELLNSPRIENLPNPPEESRPFKPAGSPTFDDAPLPPPPDEFLTPFTQKENPDLPLPLPPVSEYQSSSDTSTPKKPTSPVYNTFSPNYVGISAAKPFESAGGNGGPKFRPMSANFKGGKLSKPSSP